MLHSSISSTSVSFSFLPILRGTWKQEDAEEEEH